VGEYAKDALGEGECAKHAP
jgi:hypothetical protein